MTLQEVNVMDSVLQAGEKTGEYKSCTLLVRRSKKA